MATDPLVVQDATINKLVVSDLQVKQNKSLLRWSQVYKHIQVGLLNGGVTAKLTLLNKGQKGIRGNESYVLGTDLVKYTLQIHNATVIHVGLIKDDDVSNLTVRPELISFKYETVGIDTELDVDIQLDKILFTFNGVTQSFNTVALAGQTFYPWICGDPSSLNGYSVSLINLGCVTMSLLNGEFKIDTSVDAGNAENVTINITTGDAPITFNTGNSAVMFNTGTASVSFTAPIDAPSPPGGNLIDVICTSDINVPLTIKTGSGAGPFGDAITIDKDQVINGLRGVTGKPGQNMYFVNSTNIGFEILADTHATHAGFLHTDIGMRSVQYEGHGGELRLINSDPGGFTQLQGSTLWIQSGNPLKKAIVCGAEGRVTIGDPSVSDEKAWLTVGPNGTTTDKGFRLPTVTSTELTSGNLAGVTPGMLVYNSTTSSYWASTPAGWREVQLGATPP